MDSPTQIDPLPWCDTLAAALEWSRTAGPLAAEARKRAAEVFPPHTVSYFYEAGSGDLGCYTTGEPVDVGILKEAGLDLAARVLSLDELQAPGQAWVKLAYSRGVKQADWYDHLPVQPSPLAATIAGALVGAGLGWGGGKLLQSIAPEGYGQHLGRSGALAGAALGAAPGGVWAAANNANNRSVTDPWPAGPALQAARDKRMPDPLGVPEAFPWLADLGEDAARSYRRGAPPELDGLMPGVKRRTAIDRFMRRFERSKAGSDAVGAPADVNIDALGRTLWDAEAPPEMAAQTMGTMLAAKHFDDPDDRPGWVTGRQLGRLAAAAGGGYATGYLAGAAINQVVGTPYRAGLFGWGGAALGVIGSVIPKIYGA